MNEVADKIGRIRRFLNNIESYDLDQLSDTDKERLRGQAVGVKDAATFLYWELMGIIDPDFQGGAK